MDTIIIINGGRVVILGQGVYLPVIYIHLGYVSTFSFVAVVVTINIEERNKVNLLQIDFHHGQGHSLGFKPISSVVLSKFRIFFACNPHCLRLKGGVFGHFRSPRFLRV